MTKPEDERHPSRPEKGTTVGRRVINAFLQTQDTDREPKRRGERLDRVITDTPKRLEKKYGLKGRKLADAAWERMQRGLDAVRRLMDSDQE